MSLAVLDTSALTTHFFEETGWEVVQEYLDRRDWVVTVAAPSLFEFHFVLKAKGLSPVDLAETLKIYAAVFDDALPVDGDVARKAIEIRESSNERIPMPDALIAACAVCHQAVLIHRDSHMAAIPSRQVHQVRLPD